MHGGGRGSNGAATAARDDAAMSIREREEELVVGERFQGLPEVAHGGYVTGAMADGLDAESIEVRLRRPVPTGRPLDLERVASGSIELREGEALLAVGTPTELAMEVPPPISASEAEEASERFPAYDHHPIPGCVVCGTDREPRDGLRIFPGPVAGRRLVAAPWTPDAPSAAAAGRLASAALDCVELWALIVHAPPGTCDLVVSAALELRRLRPVDPGAPHVVIGWPIGRESRAWLAGAAVFGPGGELCVVGRQRAAITSWGVPLGQAQSG